MTGIEAWRQAYEEVYRDASHADAVPCPNCGARALRLLFVVRNDDDEDGTAVFWCDACRYGLLPVRAPVPAAGERRRKGTESVPDYLLVAEGL